MAQPDDFRTNVQELQRTDAANQVCIECQSPNPQWASVSYGTFFCLDCSGTHRSLGVHLSFVRSITMDRWSQDQFRKMQMGGNAQFAAYAAAHADELGTKSLPAKYASRAAAIYRAQLTAACEGRPFDPATVQWSPPSAPPSAAATPAMGASPALGLGGGSGFGSASFGAGAPMAAPGSGFGSTGSMGGAPTREQNEDYFNRMGNANAGRSEHLPPSQGGRYQGFGSSPMPMSSASPASSFPIDPAAILNDPSAALSKGWSLLGTVASVAASAAASAATAAVRTTSTIVGDPALSANLSETVARTAAVAGGLLTRVGEKAMETGTRAYGMLDAQRQQQLTGAAAGVFGPVPGAKGGAGGAISSAATTGDAFFASMTAPTSAAAVPAPFGSAVPFGAPAAPFGAAAGPFGGMGSTSSQTGFGSSSYGAPATMAAASPVTAATPPPAFGEPAPVNNGSDGVMMSSSAGAPSAAVGAGTSATQRKTKKDDEWEEW